MAEDIEEPEIAPEIRPTLRATAPQQEYTNKQVAIGAVLLLVGVVLTFVVPLALV